jgi:hypothetical protein
LYTPVSRSIKIEADENWILAARAGNTATNYFDGKISMNDDQLKTMYMGNWEQDEEKLRMLVCKIIN